MYRELPHNGDCQIYPSERLWWIGVNRNEQGWLNTLAEQLGGGWPSRGQIGAWLKRRAVLHVARRDVFVSRMAATMCAFEKMASTIRP